MILLVLFSYTIGILLSAGAFAGLIVGRIRGANPNRSIRGGMIGAFGVGSITCASIGHLIVLGGAFLNISVTLFILGSVGEFLSRRPSRYRGR